MPTYDLPGVTLDPLPAPATFGQLIDVTNLSDIAASLRIPAGATPAVGIKSLPDPWAQVRLFTLSLLNDHDELHGDSVAKWRGMLALLALQPFFARQYALQVRSLNLAENEGRSRLFRRVLHDLTPGATLTATASWQNLSVLMFTDVSRGPFQAAAAAQPVGLLSPATLVAPGRTATSTEPLRHAHVPWLVGGLGDPIAAHGLSSQHYAALADYAQDLAQGLVDEGATAHHHDRAARLLKQLERFHRDAKARTIESLQLPMVRVRPHRNWPNQRLYAALGAAFEVDNTNIPVGDSLGRLSIRRDARGLVEGVILIDPTLAETLGRPPQDIPIFGRYSLSDALSPGGFDAVKTDAAGAGILVVRPEDFFTNQFVRLYGDDAAPGNPPTFRSALLPLSPLALMFFSRTDLAQAAELSHVGETALVRLRLPLEPDPRRPRVNHHVLNREYGADTTFKAERDDELSIWPDFEADVWPWRFLHFRCNPRYYLQPRFGLSARFLKAEIESRTATPRERVGALLDWAAPDGLAVDRRLYANRESTIKSADGKLLMRRLRFADTDEEVGETQRLPLGVEAVFFARRLEPRQGSEEPVGCVFIPYKPVTQQGEGTATVSVDFGTTNTLAYSLRGGAIRPVTFSDRVVFPLALTRDAVGQRQFLAPNYAEFFPLKGVPSPFPTVVKVRGDVQNANGERLEAIPLITEGGADDHGFSDAAFFVPDDHGPTSIVYLLKLIKAHELIFELKWRVDPQEKKLIKRFLRQIIFMITAELYATGAAPQGIKWRFSYPQSFRPSAATGFEGYVRLAWTEVFREFPALADADSRNFVQMLTEGEAIFRYFTADRDQRYALQGDLMIMLDIGGGSTDIAISASAEGGIAWRGSFEMAGGHFFTRYLANNPAILQEVSLAEVAKFVTADGETDADVARSFIELFVSAPTFANAFEKAYTAIGEIPVGQGLWCCAATALAGILYYVGLVVKEALDAAEAQLAVADITGEHRRLTRDDIKSISFAFGGRGSSFFRQFSGDSSSQLSRVCRVFLHAAGLANGAVEIETMFSRKGQAKHEVARGLLAPEAARPRAGVKMDFKPLGEAIVTGAGALPSGGEGGQGRDLIAQANSPQGREVRGLDDANLRRMLEVFADETGIVIDLAERKGAAVVKERALSELRKELKKLEAEDRDPGRTANSQAIPPPFILEVVALVELLSMPLNERDRRLSVRERDI